MKRVPLPIHDPRWVSLILITVALVFLVIVVIIPIIAIFVQAFYRGIDAYFGAIKDAETVNAIILSLKVASVAVALNLVFGLTASWAIGKFKFPGKQLLVTLIDLPLSVSPVIAGLVFVLLFNPQSILGSLFSYVDIQILYAFPSLVLATLFVTFPYVARELIPLAQQHGCDEEEAAIMLGAGGINTFFRVTFQNMKWGVLYGTLICSARALGEFGAVSVVSGHIQGLTNTIPLQVEVLYNEYHFQAAFAVSSLLACFALVTLVLKKAIELRLR